MTLHVGAGTFLPSRPRTTADHRMHAEWGTIPAETAAKLNETRARGGRIVAVGTTSLRLLESAVDENGIILRLPMKRRSSSRPASRCARPMP